MEYLIAADAPAESADAIYSSQFKNHSDAEKVGGTSKKSCPKVRIPFRLFHMLIVDEFLHAHVKFITDCLKHNAALKTLP